MKVYQEMMDVLEGRVLLTEASASIQSCVRLPLYQKARQILDLPTRDKRRWEIEKAHPMIRPFLEEEIMRIWELRKADK